MACEAVQAVHIVCSLVKEDYREDSRTCSPMAGPSDGSNSAWRLDDLKELEQTLNYDIASGFSDLEITGLTKEVGAYNMSDVLSLPLFNDGGSEGALNGTSPGRTKVMGEADAPSLIATSRPPASAPIPMEKVKQEEAGGKDRQEDKIVIVLLAQTAFGTKVADETVTYLNKGQAYEVKLFTTDGQPKDKLFKSTVRLCFYERRYQFSEQEQIISWQIEHPGERMLVLDRAGCYGVSNVEQEGQRVNVVCFIWNAAQEGIASIKVNCLSTEFSAKKHGGERGVPLQLMVDTFLVGTDNEEFHCHRSYCQIKVFKDKGAERKHKMDQQRLAKLSQDDMAKYKPAYQITLMKEVPVPNTRNFSMFGSPLDSATVVRGGKALQTTPTPAALSSTPPSTIPLPLPSNGLVQATSIVVQPVVPGKALSNSSTSNGTTSTAGNTTPTAERKPLIGPGSSHLETRQWLHNNRFGQYLNLFANFSAEDLLRMSRKDLIDICGPGDGIRLFNLLRMKPKLTLYVSKGSDALYQAIFLTRTSASELVEKLCAKFNFEQSTIHSIARMCTSGVAVALDDSFISNLEDEAAFSLHVCHVEGTNQYRILLKDSHPQLDPSHSATME